MPCEHNETLGVVDKTALTIGVGNWEYVYITGSGLYTVTSDNTAIATATLSGMRITVNGIATGNAVITVKDNQSNQTKTISVEVKASTPVVGKWKMTSYRRIVGIYLGPWTTPGDDEYWIDFKVDGTWQAKSTPPGTYTYDAATKTLTMTGDDFAAYIKYEEISLTSNYWEFTAEQKYTTKCQYKWSKM